MHQSPSRACATSYILPEHLYMRLASHVNNLRTVHKNGPLPDGSVGTALDSNSLGRGLDPWCGESLAQLGNHHWLL